MNRFKFSQYSERGLRAVRGVLDHPRTHAVRRVMVPVGLLVGCVFFGYVVNRHYPIKDWLFLRYAKSWLLALTWVSACLSGGHFILRRLGPRLPLGEHLVLSFSTGMYAFFFLMFLGGIGGLYRFALFAPLLAAVMLASGARSFYEKCSRAWRHMQSARRLAPPKLSPISAAITAFGTFYLGLVYLNILNPDNASFDSVYYHLGIAQQYKELGGIFRTPEGWIVDGLPLLGSTLYAWAFIFPTNDLFDALMGSAHMEFAIFAATLFSIPTLVRWMVPRARTWGSWVAMFLFPAILVYDAGLHSANDHIAAFWGIPIWLALRHSWPRLEPRYMVLFAVSAAGALMTKYQAAGLVLAPMLALLVRGAVLALRRAGAPVGRGIGMALGVGVLVTTPLWLKNWLWYGDPFFPALYKYVTVRPFHPHAAEMLSRLSGDLPRPYGSFWQQIRQIVRGSFAFPFVTHERADFHKDWPIFGPLFHLSLLWLPFLRNTKRTWILFGATLSGLFFWYFFNHYERYLQPMIPWMAAVAAASMALVWQRGWVTKLAAVGMVGLELVWGADVYFFPHLMLGEAPIRATAEFVTTGFRGDLGRRDKFQRPLKDIGAGLPEGAKVLLHEHNPRLGLGAPVVMDMPLFQTLISYQDLRSARAVYDLYRSVGVTHIVYQDAVAWCFDTLAGDLRFWEFVTNFGVNRKKYDGFMVAEMPTEPPPDVPWQNEVAYLGCDEAFEPGLYPIDAFMSDGARPARPSEAAPKGKRGLEAFVVRAGFLVTNRACKTPQVPPPVYRDFKKATTRCSEDLWIRKLPGGNER